MDGGFKEGKKKRKEKGIITMLSYAYKHTSTCNAEADKTPYVCMREHF